MITYYSLMFLIAYTFKGQMHVFARRVKILSHLSCIKILLTPGIELVTVTMDDSDQLGVLTAQTGLYQCQFQGGCH